MKAQRLIHATRGQGRVAERADEPSSYGKCMNNRQAMDTHGSGAHTQDSGITNLYPANTRVVGHGSRVREGMVWQWEEGESLF